MSQNICHSILFYSVKALYSNHWGCFLAYLKNKDVKFPENRQDPKSHRTAPLQVLVQSLLELGEGGHCSSFAV